MPFAYGASWKIDHDEPRYFGCLLIIQGSLLGVFTATNFFLWFFFYEISLVPAFFLVKLWGSPGKDRSAFKFFVYSMAGSIALLLGFLALAGATGSFEFEEIARQSSSGNLANLIGSNLGWFDMPLGWLCAIIFGLIFVGLAVKVPWMPFHAWLPDTYDHAPSPVTMVLTGLMSKMGLYGLIRMGLPIAPYALPKILTPLLMITVFGIIYSAFAAMGQRNVKRMFAYSSINHLGYCMLGILSLGVVTNGDMNLGVQKTAVLGGIMLQMFAHGIIASVLFYFVSTMENRIGTEVND
jgi:NADH-quinone oxidoreductase subunit M